MREVILAQIKFAWWRERLAEAPAARPQGEPILAALATWRAPAAPLLALIDGWEAMLDPDEPNFAALAEGRAALGRGLAEQAGAADAGDSAAAALRGWSLAQTAAITTANARAALPRLAALFPDD